jgi:hypothetical protein
MTLNRRTSVALILYATFLAHGQTKPDGFVNVQWMRLRGLNYKTGRINDDVKTLNEALIQIEGYIVPLEDDLRESSEFLLVSSAGACIHTPPPPPNQIIHVKVTGNKRAKVAVGKLFWVKGRLRIATTKGPYGDMSYEMDAQVVDPEE